MGHEHPREDRPPTPDSLDARIAGLVSSNILPPAPPAPPTLHDRLIDRYREIRRLRRQITRDTHQVRRQRAAFQPVRRGRLLSLMAQQAVYSRREVDLAARIDAHQDYMEQYPDADPNEMDSSGDDEEIVFGRDATPILDYASDSDGPEEVSFHVGQGPDAPALSYSVDEVEAYLRDAGRPSRARTAAGARIRSWAVEDTQVLPGPAEYLDDAIAGSHGYLQRSRSGLVSSGIQLAPDDGGHEDASESEESPFDSDEEDEGEGDEDEEDDEGMEPDLSSESEADENNVYLERPSRWQTFHQFFMYSCRGDVSAVTSELQEMFRFEPAVSEHSGTD
jgi:hypothetical protein